MSTAQCFNSVVKTDTLHNGHVMLLIEETDTSILTPGRIQQFTKILRKTSTTNKLRFDHPTSSVVPWGILEKYKLELGGKGLLV